MKRRIIAMLIVLALSVSMLTACGGGNGGNSGSGGNGGSGGSNPDNGGGGNSGGDTTPVPADIGEMSDEQIIETALLAYQYALPLIIVDLTKKNVTNVNPEMGTGAPVNQISHDRLPAVPENKSVVRLNVDTLYSHAFLEIYDEPVILEKPKTDIYCTIAVFDAYTNCAAVLGTGGLDDGEAAVYAFCKSDFAGELPEGVVRIDMPTDIVWLFFRTGYENSEESLNLAHNVQDQFSTVPLSEYGNNDYTPPEGSYSTEYDYIPAQKLFAMSTSEFFNAFNEISVKNPGTVGDLPYLEKLAAIGIGAGLNFSLDEFSDEVQNILTQIPENVRASFMQGGSNSAGAAGMADSPMARYFHLNNGWNFPDSIIANFGQEYLFRAYIAITGLGANPVTMAVYPGLSRDKDGAFLDGNNNYTITFESGQLPPFLENGFWSITLYDKDSFLYANTAQKQAVRSVDNFVTNPDGSVTIYLQHESPDGDLEANWLPTPKENFNLTMRIYLPDESVTDFSWIPPYAEITE